MKQVICRAKRIDNNLWIEGFPIEYNGIAYMLDCNLLDKGIYIELSSPSNTTRFTIPGVEIDPKTIGRYTGVKDSIGNRIFEGDICFDSTIWRNDIATVIWSDETARFLFSYVLNDTRDELPFNEVNISENIEIVSNIHNNPELIKEK